MAENQHQNSGSTSNVGNKSGGIFAKASKRLSRTKTKVLQNLGKAEKTTDEVFTDNVLKIERQQETGHHLQKEVKNYMHCLRDLSQASKSLHTVLAQTYEAEWTEESTFKSQLQTFELLWNDYLQSLQDKVVSPLQTYLQSFPALRTKVAKRGRKLVDYDNSRHQLEVLQAAKKKDDLKIQKAQDELKEAKRIYEEMNEELHEELPDFYNSRVTFYASLFSSLFSTEYIFHSESGKIQGNLGDISDRLAKDFEQFAYRPKRMLSKTGSTNSGENGVNGDTSPASSPCTSIVGTPLSSTAVSPSRDRAQEKSLTLGSQDGEERKVDEEEEEEDASSSQVNGEEASDEEEEGEEPPTPTPTPTSAPAPAPRTVDVGSRGGKEEPPSENNLYEDPDAPSEDKHTYSNENVAAEENKKDDNEDGGDDDDDNDDDESDSDANLYSNPPSNKPVVSPPEGTLYSVQATHKYTGEDVDELNFEPGEIIFVITFENSDEQDDGWQMGIKKSDGRKGVFPENFTQKI